MRPRLHDSAPVAPRMLLYLLSMHNFFNLHSRCIIFLCIALVCVPTQVKKKSQATLTGDKDKRRINLLTTYKYNFSTKTIGERIQLFHWLNTSGLCFGEEDGICAEKCCHPTQNDLILLYFTPVGVVIDGGIYKELNDYKVE